MVVLFNFEHKILFTRYYAVFVVFILSIETLNQFFSEQGGRIGCSLIIVKGEFITDVIISFIF
jgi:hypothetical protein